MASAKGIDFADTILIYPLICFCGIMCTIVNSGIYSHTGIIADSVFDQPAIAVNILIISFQTRLQSRIEIKEI